jgi:plastocyanin
MQKIHTQKFQVSIVLFLVILLAACSSASRQDVANRENAAGQTTVNIVTDDFSFSVDATQVPAGMVSFVVENNGNTPHDFSISGNGMEQKTPIIEPEKSAVLEVDLEPGTYKYVCSVPGHEMLGMKGTLIVKSDT